MTLHRAAATASGWLLAGALLGTGLLSIASIGLALLAAGGMLVVILGRHTEPHVPALVAGAGLALVAIGLVDVLDGAPACTAAGVSDPPRPGQPTECESGGIPGLALAAAGAAAVVGAAVTAHRTR